MKIQMKQAALAGAIAVATVFAAPGAQANPVPFGGSSGTAGTPGATAAIGISTDPAVNTTAHTAEFGGNISINSVLGGGLSVTGDLVGNVTGAGTISSGGASTITLNFSSVVGQTLTQTVNNFIELTDTSTSGTTGYFNFNVTSVETTAYTVNGNTGSIGLYLLGTMGDSVSGSSVQFTPTQTSLTITMNNTRGSGWSSSATLANPPAPPNLVPEPMSLAVMGVGLAGLGLVRRRKGA